MIRQNSPWQWLILFCGVIWMVGCTISVDSRTAAPAMASPSPISPATPSPTGLATPGEPGRIDLSEGLYIRQIRPDAFIVTHEFPWPANSLIVEMENSDLVWVGTPYTPAATNEVLDWIETRWGKRNIVAINTGYHVDNLGGNSALIEHGITVWGSDLTAQLLEERGEQTRQVILAMLQGSGNERYYLAHKDIPYVAPTQLFPIADGLELQFGNDKIQVYYPGPSHAPDTVVVYFPGKRILFGGCMLLAGEQIGNTSDADLKNWPEAVRKLLQFDAEFVVPGHGERFDPGIIQHTIDLLTHES
jgi:metallo-beta-lactamase class B